MSQDTLVIFTREPEDNQPVIELLPGVAALEYPCLETRYLEIPPEFLEKPDLPEFDVIAFTSRRAIHGAMPIAEKLSKSISLIAAVGQRTAREIAEFLGRKADIIPEEETGEALARAIIAAFPQKARILYVRGTKTEGSLKALLEESGFSFSELTVYETVPRSLKPIVINRPTIVFFGSPSAAEVFFSANPNTQDKIICAAIGPTTARALLKLGAAEVKTARDPSPKSVSELIFRIIKDRKEKR